MEQKYKLGQSAFCIRNMKAIELRILAVKISKDSDILYSFSSTNNEEAVFGWIEQYEIFPSKEELLASL